jgi:dTDP-glucose 4,6-dehydratase
MAIQKSAHHEMKHQKYAVLGSNSFAGAAFVSRALADGSEVLGVSRSTEPSDIFLPYRDLANPGNWNFVHADINNDLDLIISQLNEFKPSVIVDFAGQGMVAESWGNPEQWYSTNIVAKVRLHEALRQCDWLERYIRISTPEVYGSQDDTTSENWSYNPSTPYAVSHAAIDMSLRAYYQQYDFPVIFTRFANFYGPTQQLFRIIPRTIIHALTDRKLQLHGGGTSVRAFVYGADVADGIMRASKSGTIGEVYHFSSQRFLTIRQVVEIVCARLGVDFSVLAEVAPERQGKDHAYLMNSEKARETLGWKESCSFEEGVDATINWVRGSMDEILGLPLEYIHKT